MSSTETYVANAEQYAASFDKGHLPLPPAKQTAVVACMDARLNPYGVLGLSEGDSHVIRNAGGVVTDDVIRSLTISQRLLGIVGVLVAIPVAAAIRLLLQEVAFPRLDKS